MKKNIRTWALEGVSLGINKSDLFDLVFHVSGEKVQDDTNVEEIYREQGSVKRAAAVLHRDPRRVALELQEKGILTGKPGRPKTVSSGSYAPVAKPVTTTARTFAATISLAGSAVKFLKDTGKPMTGRELRDHLRGAGVNSNRTYFGYMLNRLAVRGDVKRKYSTQHHAYLYTA